MLQWQIVNGDLLRNAVLETKMFLIRPCFPTHVTIWCTFSTWPLPSHLSPSMFCPNRHSYRILIDQHPSHRIAASLAAEETTSPGCSAPTLRNQFRHSLYYVNIENEFESDVPGKWLRFNSSSDAFFAFIILFLISTHSELLSAILEDHAKLWRT